MRILAVGEAPGHRGSRLTGITFTRCNELQNPQHRLIVNLREMELYNPQPAVAENCASCVWDCLLNIHINPLFWNALPFHPHKYDNQNSNRKPTVDELREGHPFLSILVGWYDFCNGR